MAFSVVLLIGAGLFVRSFAHARAVPLGFDVRPVVEVAADLRGQDMSADQRIALRNRLLEVAQALPGVEAATAVNSRLFGTNTGWLQVPGIDSVAALGRFSFQVATPSYFTVMRTPIVRGRAFDDSDRLGTPRVAVVSNSMAEALWPNENPLLEARPQQVRATATGGNGVDPADGHQAATRAARHPHHCRLACTAAIAQQKASAADAGAARNEAGLGDFRGAAPTRMPATKAVPVNAGAAMARAARWPAPGRSAPPPAC